MYIVRYMKIIIKLIGLVMLFPALAYADQGRQSLDTFLANTQTIEASFQQKLLDNKGILLQQSAGQFTLKRPGKFIWNYRLPYPQIIVSNSKKIWVFDSELEQVSIKQYSEMLSGAPVALLDQRKKIEDDFVITDAGIVQGQNWVKLKPRSADSEFLEIHVGMANGNLKSMRLMDGFGQTTSIEFEQMQINVSLEDALFEFKPPAGVDVIGQ